jgi:hypothetical protein
MSAIAMPGHGALAVLALAAAGLAGAAVASPKGAEWTVSETPEACGGCHLGSPEPTDSEALAIEGLPERVRPAETYALEIVLRDPDLRIAGFFLEVTSVAASPGASSDADAPAGTLSSVDATTETLESKARSTRAGTRPPTPGAMRWRLAWTAPPSLDAPVRFEIWANAGNDDLSPLGDRLHRRTWEVLTAD